MEGTSPKQLALNERIRKLLDSKTRFTKADKALLREYRGSGGSEAKTELETLSEFYTPEILVKACWDLAKKHGFKGGKVLEPSCGTGNFFAHAPKEADCIGFEISDYSAKIARILYPKATIYQQPFETAFMEKPVFRSLMNRKPYTWLEEHPFSLAIGNPPFGNYGGIQAAYFRKSTIFGKKLKPTQFEIFFMFLSLMQLEKGGLLVFVIPQSFMRNGNLYNREKVVLGEMAELVDALRFPTVFGTTEVPTDIIVLRKK